MDDFVLLGRVRRARGIRGEVVVDPVGTHPERFQPGLELMVVPAGGEGSYLARVEVAWMHNSELVLKFEGIEDRTGAEALRGCELRIAGAERPPAPEGEYYLSDITGCRVEAPDGRVIGEVTAWHDFGAAPLLEVRSGTGREILVPFTEAIYREVDIPGRRIVVELPEGLEELNSR